MIGMLIVSPLVLFLRKPLAQLANKEYKPGNRRYASQYEDPTYPRIPCDARRWVRHADT